MGLIKLRRAVSEQLIAILMWRAAPSVITVSGLGEMHLHLSRLKEMFHLKVVFLLW